MACQPPRHVGLTARDRVEELGPTVDARRVAAVGADATDGHLDEHVIGVGKGQWVACVGVGALEELIFEHAPEALNNKVDPVHVGNSSGDAKG